MSKKGKAIPKGDKHEDIPVWHWFVMSYASVGVGCLFWLKLLKPTGGEWTVFVILPVAFIALFLFRVLYGPVEAQDGHIEGKERG